MELLGIARLVTLVVGRAVWVNRDAMLVTLEDIIQSTAHTRLAPNVSQGRVPLGASRLALIAQRIELPFILGKVLAWIVPLGCLPMRPTRCAFVHRAFTWTLLCPWDQMLL